MALNIFLFFPVTDNQILNDNSNQIVFNFFEISNKIKNDGEIKLFFDSENVATFFSQNRISEFYLEKDINKLRIKLSKNSAIDIQTKNLIDKSCFYFQWNLDSFKVDNCFEILKEIAERKIQFDSEEYVLINFNNSIEYCRERILVFKDSKHINKFPNNFIHIDFVSDFLEFEIWLKTNHIKNFSLLDKNKFRKTSLIQQGKPVYESIETGCFWYLDNFHKDEYEVFDTNKRHIGVADLNGKLDTAKAIAGRDF